MSTRIQLEIIYLEISFDSLYTVCVVYVFSEIKYQKGQSNITSMPKKKKKGLQLYQQLLALRNNNNISGRNQKQVVQKIYFCFAFCNVGLRKYKRYQKNC